MALVSFINLKDLIWRLEVLFSIERAIKYALVSQRYCLSTAVFQRTRAGVSHPLRL